MEILDMAVNVEKRVNGLEKLVGKFVSETGAALLRMERGLEDFKKEMSNFKNDMQSQVVRMNFQWGNLANRLGTLVEDLVFPSLDRIIREQFDVTPEIIMVRVQSKKMDGRKNSMPLPLLKNGFF
jgi:hypothetical protein